MYTAWFNRELNIQLLGRKRIGRSSSKRENSEKKKKKDSERGTRKKRCGIEKVSPHDRT